MNCSAALRYPAAIVDPSDPPEPADLPDPEVIFAHTVESCRQFGIEPPSRDHVEQLAGEWNRLILGDDAARNYDRVEILRPGQGSSVARVAPPIASKIDDAPRACPMDRPAPVSGRLALVFDASSYVGTNLVPALARRGVPVRAAARDREVLDGRGWEGVELTTADALDPASLGAALAGVDVAYYLVRALATRRRFGKHDLAAADNFARAAAEAGVRRIVYLGALVPERVDSGRLAWQRQIGDLLRAGAVPVTEIRAAIILGPGSAAYEMFRDLVCNLPVMVTPRWVQSRSAPIALANLIEYLLRVPELDETAGGIYDACGADYLSYEAMMRTFGDVVGRIPRIFRLPVVSLRLSAYWLGLVTTVPANIARAVITGLKQDIPAHDDALRQLVPQRLLGFREAIVAALDAERRNAVVARWTEGVLMSRDERTDFASFAKKASGAAETGASPEAVWRVVTSLGGDNRYFYFDWIWTLREAADWLVGGPGLTRGRRDPHELRLGDTIDYWTVIGLEPPRRLTLDFGLLAHGTGVLDFRIEPLANGRTRLVETAYWRPRGIRGLLYWVALVPFHLFIFKGMTRAIVRRAEESTDRPRVK